MRLWGDGLVKWGPRSEPILVMEESGVRFTVEETYLNSSGQDYSQGSVSSVV